MSRTYRCRVKKDVRETSRVYDEVEYKISLLDVLDQDGMEEEYRKALKDMGAKETEDGKLVLKVDEVEVTIDPKERKAKAKISEDKDIVVKVDKEENVYDWSDDRKTAQKKLENQVEKEINKQLSNKKEKHETEVRSKLEEAQDKIKEKLREAANEAHKSALRKKARRMGKVIADQEDELPGGDRRLTIEIDLG